MRLSAVSPRHVMCAALALAAMAAVPAGAATFAGANLGAIPDNDPAGRIITFNVNGETQGVRSVSLSLGITHPWIADLSATLFSPDGVAQLVIFGRAGRGRVSASGHSTNLDGVYVFSDAATGDLWGTIAGQNGTFQVPSGGYRTTTAGKPDLSDIGGCSTHLNRAFGGLSGARLNGTWTLALNDLGNGDLGTVTSAALSIQTGPDLFGGGFEDIEPASGIGPASATRGRCVEVTYDFTGTGLTSYTVVRNTGGGPNGAITWYVRENDNTAMGNEQEFLLGKSGDSFVDGDFDGDGIRDAGVWTGTAPARYTIRRSSRPTDEPLRISFGLLGDNVSISGDYDGDNVTDVAHYRAGAMAGQVSKALIRLSRTGEVRTFDAGENGHFGSGGLDHDGDGLADVVVQSNAGGGTARFHVFNGVSGVSVENFIFGKPTDVIITGTHTGDARADVTLVRGEGGVIQNITRDGSSGIEQAAVPFGTSATDFPLSGDFDGDGVYDYANWRPSATPGESKFSVRRSLDPGTPLEVFAGQNGDYPPANGRRN